MQQTRRSAPYPFQEMTTRAEVHSGTLAPTRNPRAAFGKIIQMSMALKEDDHESTWSIRATVSNS